MCHAFFLVGFGEVMVLGPRPILLSVHQVTSPWNRASLDLFILYLECLCFSSLYCSVSSLALLCLFMFMYVIIGFTGSSYNLFLVV